MPLPLVANALETAQPQTMPRTCRFYQTSKGCRAGDSCPYRHEKSAVNDTAAPRRHQVPLVDRSKVVQKPKPAVEDVRTFQLGQIQRRFNTQPLNIEDGVRYSFDMAPSDPDFPYDLDALECQLDVPQSYPGTGKPRLTILNKDIPRGFQINIERGFTALATSNPDATLLGLMNRLDRQLETILSGEMADTIKIIVNKPSTVSAPSPKPQHEQAQEQVNRVQAPVQPAHTAAQKADARIRRDQETRQLEARFGRLPAFVKSSDGLHYSLPLDSPKKSTWPAPLQSLRICTLIVPELYPLDPPMLILDSESDEAKHVAQAFTKKATQNSTLTLTQLVNNLLVNIKEMAVKPVEQDATDNGRSIHHAQTDNSSAYSTDNQAAPPIAIDPDRPHLHHISRPPEWDIPNAHDSTDSSYSEGDDHDLSDNIQGSSGDEEPTEERIYASTPIERGVLLSFPRMELHGIELLELTSLNLSVRCTRCKDTTDIERIRSIVNISMTDTGPATTPAPRTESCKKCAQPMTIGFRADLMHASSVRGGYLDLDGCTPADLLPSSFTPTCSDCSTPYPAPGIVAVRGETAMAICRTCHRKMTLRIQEERFLQVSATAIRTSRLPLRKKEKEKLGIVAGTELPRRGRCSHYGKSYRWFRFSCCNKVFACDRCHDEEVEHANEHANRMICGFCSREQNYRPEDCGICHAVLVGKRGHGFWEGGKGTRDKARMSRKDPRKYKRVGGGQLRKS